MRPSYIVLVSLFLVACANRATLPESWGIAYSKRVVGCGTPVNSEHFAYKNVVLGSELSSNLISQLKAQQVESPRCWTLRSDGLLELDAGPFCDTKLAATFREREGVWRLESEREDLLVMCHERKR